ncbi:MAG: DUF4062 domain-containing protein [Planctomycetota bacterium]
MASPLKVFISSTSKDLRSFRAEVKDALLDRGVYPVVKEHFGPTHLLLSDYLREQLRDCDAVICIVGFLFGGAPDGQEESPRRSWTQLEYDYATSNRIPLVLLVADELCQFDCEIVQSTEDARLQALFRERILHDARKHELFRTKEDLRQHILKIDYEELRKCQTKRHAEKRFYLLRRIVQLALIVLLLISLGAFVAIRQIQKTPPTEFRHNELTLGHGSMTIPIELVYTAKVGDRFSPIRIQSVIGSESTYKLPDDLMEAREEFAKEQAARTAASQPAAWDGTIFRLKGWDLNASVDGTSRILVLQVEPGKYFDFAVTHLRMKNIMVADNAGKMTTAWDKYVSSYDQSFNGQPNPTLSNMFGVSITAVTSDGYVVLSRRSKRNAVVPEFIHVSVAETTKAKDPLKPGEPADDDFDRGLLVYNTVVRGLNEELCVPQFDRNKVEFLGLIYSPELAQFDLVGTVRLPFTASELQKRLKGCSHSTFENEKLVFKPFNASAMASYMAEEPKWSPFAAASIILALNFEFGSNSVDRDFAAVFANNPVRLTEFKFVGNH